MTAVQQSVNRALALFAPPQRYDPATWAEAFHEIPRGLSAEPGKYRLNRLPYHREPLESTVDPTATETVLLWARQLGKALDVRTKIPTPDGWTTMGEIQPGDSVYDMNGRECCVKFVTEEMRDRKCLKLELGNGEQIICDEDHLWVVDHSIRAPRPKRNKVRTREVLKASEIFAKTAPRIPVAGAISGRQTSLPVQPYTLGVWLGDGTTAAHYFHHHWKDAQIADEIRKDGYVVREISRKDNTVSEGIFTFESEAVKKGFCKYGHNKNGRPSCRTCADLIRRGKERGKRSFSFYELLRDNGLIGSKHIPEIYLRASKPDRLALLQGLMDTDGYVFAGQCEYCTTDKELALGFMELASSLALKPVLNSGFAKLYGRIVSEKFRIAFRTQNVPVARLQRKAEQVRSAERLTFCGHEIVSIKPTATVPVRCITVDSPTGTYLCGESFIPTHNTEILQILICFIIDVEPGNIFVKYPTRGKAADFSQKKLNPTIKNNPRLRGKIKPHRMRDSGNTIFSKLFPGGSITMVGANSAAALRQLSCRVVIQDEIDSDQPNSEGDPVPQADATATNFHDAILVKSSTPTQEPEDDGRGGQTGSRIQILFNDSDQRYWNVPCPKCNHWQVLKWEQVRWTWKQPDGTKVSDPKKACYVCEGCAEELSDFDRVRMIMRGKWVAKNPGNARRGYHLSGLYRIMGKKRAYVSYLHEFAMNFLKAKKDGTLEVWTNTFKAECWKLHLARLETDPLLARREHYGPELPKKVLVLTRQVDVQGDRLEVMVKGWGLGFESWGISTTILLGDPHKLEVWKKLHVLMDEKFIHPILGEMCAPITLIDSGGQSNDSGFADAVYRFVRPRQPQEIGPGVYATKGSSKIDAPLVTNRRPKKGICLKMIGTSLAKTTLHARLRNTEPGPRFCHYPHGYGFDGEYFEQLAAEAPKQIKRRGYVCTEWHKVRSRNEALDLEVLSLAAIEILNPDMQAIAAKVRAKEPEALEEHKAVVSDARPDARKTARRVFRLIRPKFGRKWGR